MPDAFLSALSRRHLGARTASSSLSRPVQSPSFLLSRPGGPLLAGAAGSVALGPIFQTLPSGYHRTVRAAARLLMVVGVLLLADAGVTLVWQEPFSAIYATIKQHDLSNSLNAIDRAQPVPAVRHALSRIHEQRRRIALLAASLERRAKSGSAVGRIEIPRVGASFVLVKGTDTADLEEGPGIYSSTNFPGIAGTTAIAGHRTTYLAPFRHIDELHAGNHILLDMPYAHFTYTVTSQRSVLPTDVRAAVAEVGYSRLVLSACTPPFSAAERLLVFARLTKTVPVGAARAA
jgi:sortase A